MKVGDIIERLARRALGPDDRRAMIVREVRADGAFAAELLTGDFGDLGDPGKTAMMFHQDHRGRTWR